MTLAIQGRLINFIWTLDERVVSILVEGGQAAIGVECLKFKQLYLLEYKGVGAEN